MNRGTDQSLGTVWRFALVATAALVLTFGRGPAASAKKRPVNINTASQAELGALRGVGPATAEKIIANRPYKNLDELGKAGLSARKIKSLKSSLTVGEPSEPSVSKTTRKEKTSGREGRKKGEPEASAKAKESKAAAVEPGAPLDLNTASLKALEALPGIGAARAKKIIAARPFSSVDDLSKVKGMSKARIKALKDKVTVSAPGSAPASSGPSAQPPSAGYESTPQAKPEAPAKEKTTAGKQLPGQKVDLNTATPEELDKLPGIGATKARAIIEGRPYHKIEDVMKVKGIKEHTFDRLKDYITVK